MNYHNLLVDRVLPVNRDEYLSLPEVLASLTQGDQIESFPGLQPHQWPAWYQFLVQVAALSTLDRPEEWRAYNPADWQAALRRLTPDHPSDEPWCLVVEDLEKPALLQPPVPEGTLNDFEGPLRSPADSSLDLLVTTRHHDLKADRGAEPGLYHWMYSLVTLQTQAGFDGRQNYGIVRMNGGFASRPLVGIATGRGWGERFRRDLGVLIRKHAELASKHERGNRIALAWMESWDGEGQLALKDCSPYVIEVARRVRLVQADHGLAAYRRGTQNARLSPKSDVFKGNVGDPWIPINSETGVALNVGATGFTYDRTRQLLLEDGFEGSLCQQAQPEDGKAEHLWLCCAALARGQGGTEGFHERWVPIPARVRTRLLDPAGKTSLGELARERVARAGNVWKSALFPALQALLKGGGGNTGSKPLAMPERWRWTYESGIDARYFPQLWADFDLDSTAQRVNWGEVLQELARSILRHAEREAPVPDARRERASAAAWGLLEAGMRKQIPEAFADHTPTRDVEEDLDADPTLP